MGVSVLAVLREVQIPLLAALLISGCAAKTWHTVKTYQADAGTEPTATFPLGPRRPAAIGLCVIELTVGVGLLLTAGRIGLGAPALTVRVAAVLLFGTGAGALYVLRARRPDAGCGCFGELSRTPVGWRVIARSVLLCAAALSLLGAPPLRRPASTGQAWLTLTVAVAELAVLCALSPEVSQLMLRLSHAEPCEVREVPVTRTLSALRASAPWRRYQQFLVATAPADVWREGCWRFVVYPGVMAGRRVEVVFAVHLAGRRVPIRVGMLDTGTHFMIPRQAVEDPLELSNYLLEKPKISEDNQ
jgi:Methylamine utilisation protein MauE